jgi:hypothetical protein
MLGKIYYLGSEVRGVQNWIPEYAMYISKAFILYRSITIIYVFDRTIHNLSWKNQSATDCALHRFAKACSFPVITARCCQ